MIFTFICKHTENIYSLTLFFFINTFEHVILSCLLGSIVSHKQSVLNHIIDNHFCFTAFKIFSLPLAFSNLTMFNCGFVRLYYLGLYYLVFVSIWDLLDSIFHQIWQVLAITSSFFCFFFCLPAGDGRQLGFTAGMCHIVSSLFFSLFSFVEIGYFLLI